MFSLLLTLSTLALAAYVGMELVRPKQPNVEAAAGAPEPIAEPKSPRRASTTRLSASAPREVALQDEARDRARCDRNELRTGHCDESELRAVYERYGRPPWIGFQLESRYEIWAAATESTILDGITQISGLPTITSLGVECRETLCRFEITFPWLESPDGSRPSNEVLSFAGDFLLPVLERAGLSTIRVDPEGTDASMVTYYLGR